MSILTGAKEPAPSRANIDRLFEPCTVGDLQLRNRFVMASLTRNRGFVPTAVNVLYYQQRAKHAALIGSEGTVIEISGSEWPYAPGIFRADQLEGWRQVVKAVHAEGCLMSCQLWHLGRVLHPLHQGGMPNVGPSAIAAKGGKFRLLTGSPGYVTPEAIVDPEYYVAMYREAAVNAKEVGFDAVELHGANGYLVHQFIDPSANQRSDKWGGSVENRCRFALRCIDEMISVWGPGRVGIKLSPNGGYNDMGFDKAATIETYSYLIQQLNARGIAYMQWARWFAFLDPTNRGTKDLDVVTELAPLFKGANFLNGDYTAESGADAIAAGQGTAIVYGRHFIPNPDFPFRARHDIPLTPFNPATAYTHPEGHPEVGYSDYDEAGAGEALKKLTVKD